VSLDVFVMPLWRFKTGDFETSLERLVGDPAKVQITGPEGTGVRRRLKGYFARRRATKEVAAIAAAVEAANGRKCAWRDDGPVVYSQQYRSGDALKLYLWWLDRRDLVPRFEPPPDRTYAPHPLYEVARDRPSHGHLRQHSLYNGYLLPCDFDHVVNVEPYLVFGTWPAHHDVASAPRVRAELEFLAGQVGLPDAATVRPGTPGGYEWTEHDPLADVKLAVAELLHILILSERHGLPVIFWG
jgi:hypothetical protein